MADRGLKVNFVAYLKEIMSQMLWDVLEYLINRRYIAGHATEFWTVYDTIINRIAL